jgi:hypothetical protein
MSAAPRVATPTKAPARSRTPLYIAAAAVVVIGAPVATWLITRSNSESAAPSVPEVPVAADAPPAAVETTPDAVAEPVAAPLTNAPAPVVSRRAAPRRAAATSAETLAANTAAPAVATPPATVAAAPVAPPPVVVVAPTPEPAQPAGPPPTAARPTQSDPDAPVVTKPQPLD